MPFTFETTPINDLVIITPRRFEDNRGEFCELYKNSDFLQQEIGFVCRQSNFVKSRRDVLRGLHYQLPPGAQGKLVTCVRGEIFDVAVDIRKSSATCGTWFGVILSAKNRKLFYIPPGFAHGYAALIDDADVMYHLSAEYAPEYERGILWNDPEIGIDWPVSDPLLSERDRQFPSFCKADLFP